VRPRTVPRALEGGQHRRGRRRRCRSPFRRRGLSAAAGLVLIDAKRGQLARRIIAGRGPSRRSCVHSQLTPETQSQARTRIHDFDHRSHWHCSEVITALLPAQASHVLTHRHTDLKDRFYARVKAQDSVPASETALREQNAELRRKLDNRRAERDEYKQAADAFSRALNVLTIENDELRRKAARPAGFTGPRPLPLLRSRVPRSERPDHERMPGTSFQSLPPGWNTGSLAETRRVASGRVAFTVAPCGLDRRRRRWASGRLADVSRAQGGRTDDGQDLAAAVPPLGPPERFAGVRWWLRAGARWTCPPTLGGT